LRLFFVMNKTMRMLTSMSAGCSAHFEASSLLAADWHAAILL